MKIDVINVDPAYAEAFEYALSKFGILDQDGKPLQLRSGTALRGRGIPDTAGEEPDYTGMVGYAVIPNDPTFSKPP